MIKGLELAAKLVVHRCYFFWNEDPRAEMGETTGFDPRGKRKRVGTLKPHRLGKEHEAS